jgi:hypothetical protein
VDDVLGLVADRLRAAGLDRLSFVSWCESGEPSPARLFSQRPDAGTVWIAGVAIDP